MIILGNIYLPLNWIGLNYHEVKNGGRKVEPGDVLQAVRDVEWEAAHGGTSYKVLYFDY